MQRSDFDFDVISGPSTLPMATTPTSAVVLPPAAPPRPAAGAPAAPGNALDPSPARREITGS